MDLSSLTLGERIVELARLATAVHLDEAIRAVGRPADSHSGKQRSSDDVRIASTSRFGNETTDPGTSRW
ncbi:MAG TPA: hypothetical protein VG269_17870 [Tepidisphaeraceae bacterium]|jgi:hypothetical protein|nr:hypothetical protein [Tepidisphaeraceae bacterium]